MGRGNTKGSTFGTCRWLPISFHSLPCNVVRISYCVLFGLVLFGLSATIANAQEIGRVETIQNTAQGYFTHYSPGDATVLVSVWGTVQGPGVYEVSQGTDLAQILSLAGGPAMGVVTEDRVERETTIRVYRTAAGVRELIFEGDPTETITQVGAYPELVDGDIIEVETTQRSKWTFRDTITAITAVATTAIAVERIINLIQGSSN